MRESPRAEGGGDGGVQGAEGGEKSTREAGVATDTAGLSCSASRTYSCSCRQQCRRMATEVRDLTALRKCHPSDFIVSICALVLL